MLREFFCSGNRSQTVWAWSGLALILLHVLFRAWIKYRLNSFYSRFYDLGGSASDIGSGEVERLEAGRDEITSLLWEFGFICMPQILVHPVFKFITNNWILSWRLTLIRSYLRRWPTDDQRIDNGAQRVHEDTQRFARGLQTCCVVVLDSVLTLCVFAPLLLTMGAQVQPSSELRAGWLLELCTLVAGVGIGGSALVGWSLVQLEVENQRVEAELRKKLVMLEEEPRAACGSIQATLPLATVQQYSDQSKSDAVVEVPIDNGTEDTHRQPLNAFGYVLQELKANYTHLYKRFAVFSLWLDTYEQTVSILPYVITAPLLFCTDTERRISLGSLTQTANVFSNVFSSLNILSDNWIDVTDWLSVLRRLREWEAHLTEVDSMGAQTDIQYGNNERNAMQM
jgi:peptide/bleomycin uptake transporter